jgi:hypothetical protein
MSSGLVKRVMPDWLLIALQRPGYPRSKLANPRYEIEKPRDENPAIIVLRNKNIVDMMKRHDTLKE